MIPAEHYAEHFLGALRRTIRDKADYVARGGPEDWASYRHMVGELAGLRAAEALVQEALKAVTEPIDDDE